MKESNWDGGERRAHIGNMDQIKRDLSETRTDVALIKNTIDANHESLRKTVTKIEELLENHNNTLYGMNGNNGHNTRIKVAEQAIENHSASDKVLFALMFAAQTAILVKQYWPH